MTPPNGNSKIRFVMVELEGSDATIQAALTTVAMLINRPATTDNGPRTTDTLPATPSAPAIAAEESAALPAPDQGQVERQLAGGESESAGPQPHPTPAKRRYKKRTPPAAPAQASSNNVRRPRIFFECKEKPGESFSVADICAMTSKVKTTVIGCLNRAKNNKFEWATVGEYHFKPKAKAFAPSPSTPIANLTTGKGNGAAFYRPSGRRSDATASRGIRNPNELERDLAEDN